MKIIVSETDNSHKHKPKFSVSISNLPGTPLTPGGGTGCGGGGPLAGYGAEKKTYWVTLSFNFKC